MRVALRNVLATGAVMAVAAVLTAGMLSSQPKAAASLLGKFDAGRIMDDAVMTKYDSMTEAEIQRFLKSKNACNNRNIHWAKEYKKVSFHIKNGKFVCLAEESFNGESAAKIIAEAARDYKINPQVLIVLIEKEQSLVTDTWPNNIQLRSAAGFGCPDNAECDKKYYGLKNQIRHAAAMFREVLNGGYTNFPIGVNMVSYHKRSSCGAGEVDIKNLATSALYRYTPYQPNTAALKAGKGKGDSCSAYGNRNFFRLFTEWFGSTTLGSTNNKNNNSLVSADKSEKSLVDGIYQINSKLFPDMNLSAESGDNIALEKINASERQKFKIRFDETQKYYKIINVATKKAVRMAKKKSQGNIEVKNFNPMECEQHWVIRKMQENNYEIVTSCSIELRLDVDERLRGRKTPNAFAYSRNENPSQRWQFKLLKSLEMNKPAEPKAPNTPASPSTNAGVKPGNNGASTSQNNGNANSSNASKPKAGMQSNGDAINAERPIADGVYVIWSKLGRNMVLDIDNAGRRQGVKVQLWQNNNTVAQAFKVAYNPAKKSYLITNINSGMAMDVMNARKTDGTGIWQWRVDNTCAQDWKIVKAEGEYYRIVSGCSGKTLDVSNAGTRNGTKIQIYTDNGTPAQRWKFVKK